MWVFFLAFLSWKNGCCRNKLAYSISNITILVISQKGTENIFMKLKMWIDGSMEAVLSNMAYLIHKSSDNAKILKMFYRSRNVGRWKSFSLP
jgi:hypothetical protein